MDDSTLVFGAQSVVAILTLMITLFIYVGIPFLVIRHFMRRGADKREYERGLLERNPEAWERFKKVEGEQTAKKHERAASAAKMGIEIARRYWGK